MKVNSKSSRSSLRPACRVGSCSGPKSHSYFPVFCYLQGHNGGHGRSCRGLLSKSEVLTAATPPHKLPGNAFKDRPWLLLEVFIPSAPTNRPLRGRWCRVANPISTLPKAPTPSREPQGALSHRPRVREGTLRSRSGHSRRRNERDPPCGVPRVPARRCGRLRRGERAGPRPRAARERALTSPRPPPRSASPWSTPEQGAEQWGPFWEPQPRRDSAHRTCRSFSAATAARLPRWPLEGRGGWPRHRFRFRCAVCEGKRFSRQFGG